ncbi:MAG: YfhO family protein [Chloroflexi bacterium]|nr:MAG: YfhO family protein [Chloroflexota bacterium]
MGRRLATSLFVPLTLAALTLLYMAPFLRALADRQALDGHDLLNQQYPLLSFIFDSVRTGRGLPLWNPYQYAGQSTVANPQATLFYPPAWIMLLLGVGPGVGWLALVHLWLGGWGMAVFTRRLGASRAGALAGGIVYEFSALMGAHLDAGHLNYLLCQAWLPWIAAAYLHAVATPRWLRAALLGAAALGLCILAGYPPLLYFALLWLVTLWLYTSLTAGQSRWHLFRPLPVMLVAAAALGAALLLPVGQFILVSSRAQSASITFSNQYALPGAQLITLLIPNLFGWPRLPGDGYWGLPFYEEVTAYVGILPLLAVFLAKRRPAALLMLAFVLLGLLVSVGVDGGLFAFLYSAGLSALFITDLQTAAADERAERLLPAVRWALPMLAALALLASFALSTYFTIHSADKNPPWRVLFSANMTGLASLFSVATWLALQAWRSPLLTRYGQRAALALTIGVALVDVWHVSAPMVNVGALTVPEPWQTLARTAPAAADFRVMTVPGDVVIWQAGASDTHHLNASGYDPLLDDRYKRLLDIGQYNPAAQIARLLGVRYAIGDRPFENAHLAGADHLQLLKQDGAWFIYQVRDPLPRAFVTPRVEVDGNDDFVRLRLATGDDQTLQTAFVAQPVPCAASRADNAISPAQIVRYDPDVVELRTYGANAGVLVLSDAYDPNWTVSVDGAPAELLRVDTALRGVCVGAGAHQVTFTYRPLLFFAGVVISMAGVLVLGVLLLVERRSARVDATSPLLL